MVLLMEAGQLPRTASLGLAGFMSSTRSWDRGVGGGRRSCVGGGSRGDMGLGDVVGRGGARLRWKPSHLGRLLALQLVTSR